MAERKKNRPPIDQLRVAGRQALVMLREKGILAKDSVIDKIINDKNAPILPGIPAYLPHDYTLKMAQQMFRDLLILWMEKCKNNHSLAENITEFYKFIIEELRVQERDFNKDISTMARSIQIKKLGNVPVLKDVFSPMRKKQVVVAMRKFMVDSFAVSVVLKNNNNVSEYANWFLDWTNDMQKLWVAPDKRDNSKKG